MLFLYCFYTEPVTKSYHLGTRRMITSYHRLISQDNSTLGAINVPFPTSFRYDVIGVRKMNTLIPINTNVISQRNRNWQIITLR